MANGSQLTKVVDKRKKPSPHCLSLELLILYKDAARGLRLEQVQYNMIYFIQFCLLSGEPKSAHSLALSNTHALLFPSLTPHLPSFLQAPSS